MTQTAFRLSALAFCFAIGATCLGQENKESTGAIKGTVRVDGHPAPNVTERAELSNLSPRDFPSGPRPSAKVVTDEEGHYKLSDLAPGDYTVTASGPLLIPAAEAAGSSTLGATVRAGSTVENFDFEMIRSGVVTGKVTNPDGKPEIMAPITLKSPAGRSLGGASLYFGNRMYFTDDRGVYRIYGLRPGRYLVSCQASPGGFPLLSAISGKPGQSAETYYPGVPDADHAKVVEVSAGAETSAIDIQLLPANKGRI